MKPGPKPTPVEKRFWAKVNKNGENGCWVWTASCDKSGYGWIGINGKMVAAHRVSLNLIGVAIESGMFVDHVCHNPSCVNPDHLRLTGYNGNNRNQKKNNRNTSGFKGVSRYAGPKGGWRAYINYNNKHIHLGLFPTAEDAHKAYCEAAVKLFGEFANFG